MGFVVGKKAAAPDGTVVHFSVAGPAGDARSFTLEVQGRRARPAAAGVVPTVTLALSSIDFVRLGAPEIVRGRRGAGSFESPSRVCNS
jgi:hypothetical protein